MRKYFFLLLFFSIFFNSAYAKNFKSKNGYIFKIPKGYEVLERDFKELYGEAEDKISLDKNLSKELLEYSDQYITYVFNRRDLSPDKSAINITTAPDDFDTTPDTLKADCNEITTLMNELYTHIEVQTYLCEQVNFDRFTDGLRIMYDSYFVNYIAIQYSFDLGKNTINVTGSCLEQNCKKLDKIINDIINNIYW